MEKHIGSQQKALYQQVGRDAEELSLLLWSISVLDIVSDSEQCLIAKLYKKVSAGLAALDIDEPPVDLSGSEKKDG